MDAAAWGIDQSYFDVRGNRLRPPDHTVSALLESMGAGDPVPPRSRVRVIRQGTSVEVGGAAELLTEDGGTVRVDGATPVDLPLGYHRLSDLDTGVSTRLIVAPATCFLNADLYAWGWALQLYALRSAKSWGIGDLGDLKRFNEWASGLGARFALINPLHSVDPWPAQESPYFPGSRCWRNPLYIEIHKVPGASQLEAGLEKWASDARSLNKDPIINRAEIHRMKQTALDRLWHFWQGGDDFVRYKATSGELLDRFAVFVAISEVHGDDWHAWPFELRHPNSPAVARAERDLAKRVDFFKWQQWILDRQLRAANDALGVIHDLAVGVNPRGCDAWMWQDVFAPRVSVGAPPDDFNLDGQDWGVMAFDPHRLALADYEPFVHTVRASLRHGLGLRIDHVMGMWRLFWIPHGASPSEGTYVRYPADDLLGILALESHRARALVIGEDLGNVEPVVREGLERSGVLSYRLLYFEDEPPDRYPREALAAVTNHDLPTLPGLWSGTDLAAQAAAGINPNEGFADAVEARICDLTGLAPAAPISDVVESLYRALSRAPSRLLAVTLEDALGLQERPNQPGTTDERPNWSLALPALEEIQSHPGPARIAALFEDRK